MTSKRVHRHIPSRIALIGLLLLPVFCRADTDAAVDASPADTGLPRISVNVTRSSVAEGMEATFRVRRNSTNGALTVNADMGGKAIWDSDYSMEGFTRFGDNRYEIHFADGQDSAVIAIDIHEDRLTEATESIILRILPSDAYAFAEEDSRAVMLIGQNGRLVTNSLDSGEGSLRQAFLNANAYPGPDTITFDSEKGPFSGPQTIRLEIPLPPVIGKLTIDGYVEGTLWKASGVTLSGNNERRLFTVGEQGELYLRGITVADGASDTGGGVLNRGKLIAEGVTFLNNAARQDGGAIANTAGRTEIVNCTFSGNSATRRGGGLDNAEGFLAVTNSTFSENRSLEGAGIFNSGTIRLSNSLLAGNGDGKDCHSTGAWDQGSRNNLIITNEGCKGIVTSEDPRLGTFGSYNGPTMTYPLLGDSPAINLGDNSAAVDHEGKRLVWDQRGNGDPRFVAGITDIGAFEHQRHPWLVIDTLEDSGARACTRSGTADCSLRGAIQLVNATGKPAVIRFAPHLFEERNAVIRLLNPLPPVFIPLTIDGSDAGGARISAIDGIPVFTCKDGGELTTRAIVDVTGTSLASCPIP